MSKPEALSIGDNVSVSFIGELEEITKTDNEDILSIRLPNGELVYSWRSLAAKSKKRGKTNERV